MDRNGKTFAFAVIMVALAIVSSGITVHAASAPTFVSQSSQGLTLQIPNNQIIYGNSETINAISSVNTDLVNLYIGGTLVSTGTGNTAYTVCGTSAQCLPIGNYVVTANDQTTDNSISENLVILQGLDLTLQSGSVAYNSPDLITGKTAAPSTDPLVLIVNNQKVATGTGSVIFTLCPSAGSSTCYSPGTYSITLQDTKYNIQTTNTITITSAAVSGLTKLNDEFCGGSGAVGSGGVIPYNNILSGHGTGEQNVLNMSVLIIFMMLMIIALLYMVSYVFSLNILREMAKVEFTEIIVTAIIVLIFLGGFNLVAAGTTSSNVFHAGGGSFGRNLYVQDCAYLSDTSISLIPPMLVMNVVVKNVIDIAESFKVYLTPADFGAIFSPFQGYNLFDKIINSLTTMTGAFIGLIMLVSVTLGFIYALFPIFLYVGIILRSLPWTRAAGGAFLGLFVGFYIVFPILLHLFLGGYIASISNLSLNNNPTVSTAQLVAAVDSKVGAGGVAETGQIVGMIAEATALFIGTSGGGSFGLVNGYMFLVIEPAAFTIFVIIVSFIISFDFAETVGALIGAPSFRAGAIFGRMIK